MADLKVKVGDSTESADNIGKPDFVPPTRKAYRVIAEAGLFKNGKTIKHGETVELTETTAQSAIAAGDIEEIK